MLSDADVDYVRESAGQRQAEAPAKPPAFPKLCGPDDTDENDRQLEEKYESLARMFDDGASPRAVRIFKDALAQDAAYWRQEASYGSKAGSAPAGKSPKYSKSKSKAKMAAEDQKTADAGKKTARIQARVTWLAKTLPRWLDSVAKTEAAPAE